MFYLFIDWFRRYFSEHLSQSRLRQMLMNRKMNRKGLAQTLYQEWKTSTPGSWFSQGEEPSHCGKERNTQRSHPPLGSIMSLPFRGLVFQH